MEFCKSFNAATQGMEQGMPIPVVITAFADKSFTFSMKTPPASFLLKRAAGLKTGKKPGSGSKEPGRGSTVGKVTMNQVREIAEQKLKDLNTRDIEQASRIIAGSARSMGIEVVG
jgi:large subunit ribosomal protein L11